MEGNNARRSSVTLVLIIFFIVLAAAIQTQASTMQTSALSETSGSVQFSSWRMSSGSLLTQTSLAVGARSTQSLANNVAYTLNTTAVTNQNSYTFRPSRYEMANPVSSYSYAAAARSPHSRHHHHRGGSNGGLATPAVSVPDAGSSLILFALALGGFAALRALPSAGRLMA